MKRIIFVLFALSFLLPAYAQDCSYFDGERIVHLTIDSTAVVVFTPTEQAYVAALPAHFKLKESLQYSDKSLDVYELDIKKSRYNLSDSELFPKELPMMPCYRNEKGKRKIPTGTISVMLKNKQDTCILREAARKVGAIVVKNYMNEYWYILQMTNDKDNNSIDIANRLYNTGLFEYVLPDFYDLIFLEISVQVEFFQGKTEPAPGLVIYVE